MTPFPWLLTSFIENIYSALLMLVVPSYENRYFSQGLWKELNSGGAKAIKDIHLPFFKMLSNFVHFCPNFQIFCPFFPIFCPFSEKLHMPLLSRIGHESPRNFSTFGYYSTPDGFKIKMPTKLFYSCMQIFVIK